MTSGAGILVALALLAATAPAALALASVAAVVLAALLGVACSHGPIGR